MNGIVAIRLVYVVKPAPGLWHLVDNCVQYMDLFKRHLFKSNQSNLFATHTHREQTVSK